MLMLKRQVGQRVMIGRDIVITVNAVEGNSATLGIECPRDIPVDREEIRRVKELGNVTKAGPATMPTFLFHPND